MKKFLRYAAIAIVVILVLIQFIPIDRTNPPVTQEVQWDSPDTQALAQRACFDCHSNETVWPWYGYIAPSSLLLANHIEEGRQHLNFSEWDQPNEDIDHIVRQIEEGDMPLPGYVLMHGTANLSEAEQQTLITGLQATLAQDPPVEGRRGERD